MIITPGIRKVSLYLRSRQNRILRQWGKTGFKDTNRLLLVVRGEFTASVYKITWTQMIHVWLRKDIVIGFLPSTRWCRIQETIYCGSNGPRRKIQLDQKQLSLRVYRNDFMTSVEDWPQPLPVEKLTFSVTQARLPWTQNKLLGWEMQLWTFLKIL